ncbi:MAG: AAA family ATPase [Mariniphaga sp.]|nr:AAA family ATPase [Mariniphaga sp.]
MKTKKYLQIFNYLLEFSKLRSKPVRDIENSNNYLEILWLSNIPIDEKIDCIIHDNYSNESNYWLKISKPIEPEKPIFPNLPKTLQNWVNQESLLNRDDLPELYEEIELEEKEILKLQDYPEIEKEFNKYCSERWFSDSDLYWSTKQIFDVRYAAFDKVNSIYKKLFSIYNKSQQFGEEYELIAGIGLLNFKESDETPLICRHIISAKAEIQFEFSKRDSSLIISQSMENGLQIETDAIIDLFDQFDSNDIIESEKGAKELIKEKELVNPFDEDIHEVLQLLAERIKPGDGTYKEIKNKSKEIPKKETVFFAPAIILRKRDTRSYTSMYEKIIENIESSEKAEIPTMDDLIELEKTESLSVTQTDNIELSDSETIYFPNKFNDEQKAIIIKARFNNKVLVQGPPGTGKSHTIANLICHLLANGKRILVTAYTKRALEVLKDKLPAEFKNLTVNLLSGDSSSIQDLEASVNTINDVLSNTDIEALQKEIIELEFDLAHLKESRAFDTNELLKIKEKSSRRIEINPAYQGSLTEIAKALEVDKINQEWYDDDFKDFKNDDILEKLKIYISLFQQYACIDKSVYAYQIPAISELFEFEDFEDFENLVSIADKENLSLETIKIIKCLDFELLDNYLKELQKLFDKISVNQHPNKKELIADFLNHNKQVWLNKVEKSKAILTDLEKLDLRFIDRNIEITFPKGKSLINLKNDAKTLLDFLNDGNVLSGLSFKLKKPFFSTVIKEKLYFIDSVQVNGNPCHTKEEFGNVINDIKIKQNIEELAEIWDSYSNSSSYNEKKNFFQQLNNETLALFETISNTQVKIKLIQSISDISFNSFDINELAQVIFNTRNTLILNRISDFNKKRNEILSHLSTHNNFHPIAKNIYQSISNIATSEYKNLCKNLSQLHVDFEEYARFKNLRKELSQYFQNIIDKVECNDFTHANISNLKLAILYRHAFDELTNLLSCDFERKLNEKIKSYDSKEEKLIAQIAAKKSWVYVLINLKQNRSLRQHLEAWVQAVKKIGKTGIGKRALKFRKIAQEEMEYCKTSIPCWIMPLYKVTETIQPEQGIYDYAIIDEASQLGPDAIFLLYISKNIIIVGDDKQTSPEYVGVDANAMTPFINRHLQGIPFKNFYGTEYSFFDHAKRFCEGITVLREHFRCMPEIIEFSNKLFYAPEGKGLYPLKQYSENRLEPLMHVYCQNGYVEGQGASIRNEQEAIEICNKIQEFVDDEKYKGKSMGVICLQGNSQSALIENLLVKKIGETEFKKRKIICGNSASFQGDERDIIILSLVTAHNHNRSALTRPEDERRFNVAVSRAIEQIWLFHSVLSEDLSNSNDLRYKLLDHFINYQSVTPPMPIPIERTLGNQPEPFDSWFEVDVFNDIVNKGYSVKPQYEVAKGKYRIDLVVFFPDGTKIAIECDGDKWHGAEKYQDDMMRQKVLERVGWQFIRVRGGEYYSNRVKSLEPLWNLFKDHNFKKGKYSVQKIEDNSASNENSFVENVESGPEFQNGTDTKDENNWESKTCFWSSTFKPGYKFAINKNAWYFKKDDVLLKDQNSINPATEESTPKSNAYNFKQKDLFTNNPNLILRYFVTTQVLIF